MEGLCRATAAKLASYLQYMRKRNDIWIGYFEFDLLQLDFPKIKVRSNLGLVHSKFLSFLLSIYPFVFIV